MEHYYKSYTKTINGTTYYFVKKYTSFPEFENTPAILERYGMHVDFKKACLIAEVYDPLIIEQLYNQASSSLINEQDLTVVESHRLNNAQEKLNFAQRFNLIKKNFASRITHWHLMPH